MPPQSAAQPVLGESARAARPAPPTVLVLGPSRAAVSGVSTHLNQLFGSRLTEFYGLTQFQVGSEGRRESGPARWLRLMVSPVALAMEILHCRPAIVHLNTSMDAKAFWRDAAYFAIAKALKARTVYQVHGGALPAEFFPVGSRRSRLLQRVLEAADMVVVLGQAELAAYRHFAPAARTRRIANALDLGEFDTAQPKHFERAELRLGYLGRLNGEKGLFETLEALAVLATRHSFPFTFTIAGSGESEALLRARAGALGLASRVHFRGPVFGAEKTAFWRETDIFVFPTYREGLPYAVLEGLASGTPMITTSVGAIPDAFTDGVHGLFVPPRSPKAIADALTTVASDRKRLARMSAACLERARSDFGSDRLVREFDRLYAQVLI